MNVLRTRYAHHAAENGSAETLNFLLNIDGMIATLEDDDGYMPVMCAALRPNSAHYLECFVTSKCSALKDEYEGVGYESVTCFSSIYERFSSPREGKLSRTRDFEEQALSNMTVDYPMAGHGYERFFLDLPPRTRASYHEVSHSVSTTQE